MELWTTDSALQLHFRNQDVLVTNLISDSKQKDNIDAAPCIIGNSCDDGNPNTVNDRIKADCNCEGGPIALFCEDLSISYQLSDGLRETAGLAITVKEGDSLELFANVQDYVITDEEGTVVTHLFDDIQPEDAGTYTITTIIEETVPTDTPITATANTAKNGNPDTYAVDNKPETFWLAQYGLVFGEPYIILDLKMDSNISRLEYVTRPAGSTTGNISKYEVFVSNSNTTWKANPDRSGTWTTTTGTKFVDFNPGTHGRYVKLVAKRGLLDILNFYAAAAEIRPIRTITVTCSKSLEIKVDPINTYTFNNGTWTPIIPPAGTTPNDFIIINEGDATFESAVACRNLIVNPGASLTLKTGGVLTATSTILKSKSNSYSSLIVDGGELIGILNYERWVNQRGSAAGGGNDLISAPVSYATFNNAFRIVNSNLPENQSNLGEFAFAPYNVTAGAYQNFNIGSDYTGDIPLVPGVGYRAATNVISPQTGNTLTFSGTPTATVVTVPLSGAAKGRAWNLIGNPYPSYLNFETFFEANKDQFNANGAYQAIYGYTGASATWTVWNEATILDPEIETSMTPGQGFFVKSKSGGGTVTFTPAMQITGNSDDFILGRPKKNVALSKIRLSSGNLNGMTSIYFIDGTTKGMDPGYDAAAYGATPVNFSIFTNLVEESQGLDMAIQTLPYDDFNNVVVPLGVKAKAGSELSINIDDLSTIPPHINVYLEDTEEHTWTLLNSGAYAFSVSKDINNAKRFKLHYSARTLSLEDVQSNTKLRIYTILGSKSLFVTGQLNKAATAQLYDIQGRIVLSQALNAKSTENVIDISTVSAGIYVVKVANNNDVITQKVIIN